MVDILADSTRTNEEARISRSTFNRLAEFVTSELGIKMPETKVSMVQSRLLRRVRALGMRSIDEYCEYLFSPAGAEAERGQFINSITTNKTDFFREPHHFRYLAERALPEFESAGSRSRDSSVAIWSAACSSGEEPYTLAMVLNEYASKRSQLNFRILATDVSTKVLEIAKDGIYTSEHASPIPRELRLKYLLGGKGDMRSLVRVKPALRKCISFHQLNLMDTDYHVRDMFHFIFCRNVLIYFDRQVQQQVISKLCRNLHPGGYFFAGHSEALTDLDVPLVPLGSSIFQKSGRTAMNGRLR